MQHEIQRKEVENEKLKKQIKQWIYAKHTEYQNSIEMVTPMTSWGPTSSK